MAMTPSEMMVFFEQQGTMAFAGFNNAINSNNGVLATINLGASFRASVMQGLIGWRRGLASPVEPFRTAAQRFSQAMQSLVASNAVSGMKDVPAEQAAFIAFLVDAPMPSFAIEDFTADRLLDAALANGLCGQWDPSAWDKGLKELKKIKRAAVAVETYTTYRDLLFSEKDGVDGLVGTAARLFEKRTKDGFFSGGHGIDGGGPDNAVTVDYRLAAIMKHINYKGENIHRWKWNRVN
jgi:hypothetical protein